MNKEADDPLAAPTPHYCLDDDEKAVPLSCAYQPRQHDEYLAETTKQDSKRSHGPHTRESSKGGHHHHHGEGHYQKSTKPGDLTMKTKADAPLAAPTPHYCLDDEEKEYQPRQHDGYLAEEKKKDSNRSHGHHTTENSSKGAHHHRRPLSHGRAEEDTKPDAPPKAPSPLYSIYDDDEKAVPLRRQPGQLDEYLAETHRKGGKRSSVDGECTTERRSNRDHHSHSRAEDKMKKAAARHPDAAFHLEELAASGKQTSNVGTELIKEKRPFTSNPDDSCFTQTSALGVAALASLSTSHSIGTARAYKTQGLNSIEGEQPNMRVGATLVPGMSPTRHTSDHSDSTNGVINNEDSILPPATGEEQIVVADRVVLANEDADIEAQVQASEGIADMVRRLMLQNTATAVVRTREAPKSEDNEAGKRRKKICILAGVVVIAAAIGIALGIFFSNKKPTRIELFRNELYSVSGERLDDKDSPQYQALDWIANEDQLSTSVGVNNSETIKQRYVAAVLYFALGGENWIKKYNFLKEVPICAWNQESSGIICDPTNVRVVTLSLSKNGLSGSIPEEIGVFSDLSTINMTDGIITGTLPVSLRNLTLLEDLDLTDNFLTGTIPDFLFTYDQLTHLLLDGNSFTGTIPPSLGTSPKLKDFWAMKNNLTGSFPTSVGQSAVLVSIDLNGNSLTGTIPEFSSPSQFLYLDLDSNALDGSIPASIGNLSHLKAIHLGSNTLEGQIPTELAQCTNLVDIRFEQNNLTGDIGSVINTLPQILRGLDLTTNLLTGTIPTSIGKFTSLQFLDLGENNLNGTIPTEIGLLINLEVLALFSNQFTGTVPSILARLPLSDLNVFDNDLTGSLDEFCLLANLIKLENLVANTCGQVLVDEIACSCCSHCCFVDKVECEVI